MTHLSACPDLPGHAAWLSLGKDRNCRVYLDGAELGDVVAVDLSCPIHQVARLPRLADGRLDARRIGAGSYDYQWGRVRVVLADGREWRG